MSIEALINSLQIADPLDEDEAAAFRAHVAAELDKLRRANVAPSWANYWALRKAAQSGQPDDVIRPLISWEGAMANDYEALRYLVAENPHREALIGAFEISDFNVTLLAWAVAGRHARTVRRLLRLTAGVQTKYVLEIISALLSTAEEREAFSADIRKSLPEIADEEARLNVLRQAGLLWSLDAVLERDAADNDLSRIVMGRYDVRRPGLPGGEINARQGTMTSWLRHGPLLSTTYVDAAQTVLLQRFSLIRFIGHGAFGAVVAARNRATQGRVVLKFVALRGPAGIDTADVAMEELRVNLELTRLQPSMEVAAFPWLRDWTRVRLNLSDLLTGVRGADLENFEHTSEGNEGVGIYLVLEMPQAHTTLRALFDSLPDGMSYDEREEWYEIFVNLYAQLLVHLAQVRQAAPDFVHGDLHMGNVLLWKRPDAVVRASLPDGREIQIPVHEKTKLTVSVGDFGKARVEPSENRPDHDVDTIFGNIRVAANMSRLRGAYSLWRGSYAAPHTSEEILLMVAGLDVFREYVK